jgi:hypothetical protein
MAVLWSNDAVAANTVPAYAADGLNNAPAQAAWDAQTRRPGV